MKRRVLDSPVSRCLFVLCKSATAALLPCASGSSTSYHSTVVEQNSRLSLSPTPSSLFFLSLLSPSSTFKHPNFP